MFFKAREEYFESRNEDGKVKIFSFKIDYLYAKIYKKNLIRIKPFDLVIYTSILINFIKSKQARSRDLILTEKQLSEAVTISTETFRHFTHSQTKKILIGTSKSEEFLLNYSEIFAKSLFNEILSSVKEDMIRKHGVDAKTLQIIIVGAAIYSRDIKTSLNSQFSPGQIKMPNNPANFLVLGAVNLLKKQNKHTIKISGEFVSVELELKNSEGASVETLSESGPKDYPGALIVVSKSTNFSSIAAKFKLHNDSSTAIFKTLSCTQPSNYDPSLFTSLVFTVKLGLDFSGDEVEMLAVNHSSSGGKFKFFCISN